MFTQCCFIRKNTKELRDWLTLIGYQYGGQDIERGLKGLYCNQGTFFEVYRHTSPTRDFKIINCGDNEDLFLAIAALRKDSDYKQWFVCDETRFDCRTGECNCQEFDWVQCTEVKFEDFDAFVESWHKATTEELIEHFKCK